MLKLVTSVRLDQVTTCSSNLGDLIQSILLANWCRKSVHGNEELSILFHTYKALHSNLLLWKAFMKESLGFQQIQTSSITWLSALQVKVALKACNSCPVPHGHCGSPWGQPRDCVKQTGRDNGNSKSWKFKQENWKISMSSTTTGSVVSFPQCTHRDTSFVTLSYSVGHIFDGLCYNVNTWIYESWAKGPWKVCPLPKPLGMQLTVSAKVFFWNGERFFFSG